MFLQSFVRWIWHHISQVCLFIFYFQKIYSIHNRSENTHILSLMHAWIKKRWNLIYCFFQEIPFASPFWGHFKGFLEVWGYIQYLKWCDLRNCCSSAQAAYWFSCGRLCWSFSVVVAYFSVARWFSLGSMRLVGGGWSVNSAAHVLCSMWFTVTLCLTWMLELGAWDLDLNQTKVTERKIWN